MAEIAAALEAIPFETSMALEYETLSLEDLGELCYYRWLDYEGSKKDLIARLLEQDENKTAYNQWAPSELHKALVGRGLRNAIPYTKHATKARMIAVLEEADSSATFPRFLDLPAELRSQIINYAVAPNPSKAKVSPKEPAISAVSRQLRTESLTIFYFENSFLIEIARTYCNSDPRYHKTRLLTRHDKWLDSLSERRMMPGQAEGPQLIAYLRKLVVSDWWSNMRGVRTKELGAYSFTTVTFGLKMQNANVSDTDFWKYSVGKVLGHWAYSKPTNDEKSDHVERVLDVIVKSGGGMSKGAIMAIVGQFIQARL